MSLVFLTSSVGRKFVMALTGLGLLLFVTAHLFGNLLIFLGPDWINAYAEHLEELPALLWPARVLLLSMLLVHMVCGISLAVQNRKARPVPYQAQATIQASIPSRTMVISGIAIFIYILLHLAHFTLGRIQPESHALLDAQGRHDVYSMVVIGFRHPALAGFYLISMFFLSLHLSHGSASLLQSAGLLNGAGAKTAKKIGAAYGALLFIGYSSIVAACWIGWLRPLGGL